MTATIDKEVKVFIDAAGKTYFIYDDELQFFIEDENATTKRASHVEPCDGGWSADMSPILEIVSPEDQIQAIEMFSGPVLGPFPLRKQALEQEAEWINSFLAIFI